MFYPIEHRENNMQTQKKTLLERHTEYVDRAKLHGAPAGVLVTPCCIQRLECLVPREVGQQWDSLMTCPHCGGMFMFIATNEGCVGKRP